MTQAREELRPTRGGDLYVHREARDGPPPIGPGVWVGTIDDAVIGFAAGHVEDLRDGRRLGVIDEIYVEAEGRSVGVGEAMVGALIDWFSAEGCAGVDAHALPGARATKNFFEESGFSARLLVMHRKLGDADERA